jgi:hypothetical protein
MRGIQIADMPKLGWLIVLVEHAIWADSLHFLYLLFQFPKSKHHPNLLCGPLRRDFRLILIFLKTLLEIMHMFTEPHG